MIRHGRKPLSMTHGDFDYEYLRALALGPDGHPRFRQLRFAGHFDSLMLGRRGIPRPRTEADLHPYRRRFVAMFERLRREHGIHYDLAHNMTVTPRNLDQVAEVVRACLGMGYGMLSFQPAAYVGNRARWREDFHAVDVDAVWAQIEAGAGTRLPWRRGELADDPGVRAAQERLQACSYAMAHPEKERLVPACVQHAVLDPAENARLIQLLPMAEART